MALDSAIRGPRKAYFVECRHFHEQPLGVLDDIRSSTDIAVVRPIRGYGAD